MQGCKDARHATRIIHLHPWLSPRPIFQRACNNNWARFYLLFFARQGSGNRAFVHNTDFENNAFAGADNVTGYVDITDSSAQLNQYGFYADGGRVRLYNDRAMFNTNGLAVTGTSSANGAGNMYFAACLLSDNTNSYNIGSGGVLSGSSPGTTMIPPGQGTVGTLSAAQTLQ
ncbi:MAG TPA: hypothetical protein VN875_19660 [Candidatus Binatus sp.]|nr:hypothetical protein [Candidatus Binatus sp.]